MYNPYSKGRWYRIFIESNSTDIVLTESDLDISIESGVISMPPDFHVIDTKYDINAVEHAGKVSMIIDLVGNPDGTQGVACPVAKAFDRAYVYVFGYFG